MSENINLELDRRIAREMPRSWPAFMARFGRLTPVQRAAIPVILDGRDTLICSATSTGKTEAACAPLVENNLDMAPPWTILYISPTRALVNDLYERLDPPIRSLGLSMMRRTGDHHQSYRNIPQLLLTTPESFDSMLCRGLIDGKSGPGHALAGVSAVVLDEIHLFHGNARGEQVRWLLTRLRRMRQQAFKSGWAKHKNLQIVGLSATIANPQCLLTQFMPASEIISIPGSRSIEIVGEDRRPHSVIESLASTLNDNQGYNKVLVFSNARKRVDTLAGMLRESLERIGYVVAAHHGHLDRKIREETEELARTSRKIVVFATSTLEIGVDIGDIDLVVMDRPAPDVPALLQRIGRGNRRTDLTRVMLCAEDDAELIVQQAMISAAREGFLGSGITGSQYAIIRQQLASYIMQGPKVERSRALLQSLIKDCSLPEVGEKILNHMVSSGELKEYPSGIKLGQEWLDMSASGKIHSNIESATGSTIVDEKTGQKIAHGIQFTGGSKMQVGGGQFRCYPS